MLLLTSTLSAFLTEKTLSSIISLNLMDPNKADFLVKRRCRHRRQNLTPTAWELTIRRPIRKVSYERSIGRIRHVLATGGSQRALSDYSKKSVVTCSLQVG